MSFASVSPRNPPGPSSIGKASCVLRKCLLCRRCCLILNPPAPREIGVENGITNDSANVYLAFTVCQALSSASHVRYLANCSPQGYKGDTILTRPSSREVIKKLSEGQRRHVPVFTELMKGQARTPSQIYPVLKLMGFVRSTPHSHFHFLGSNHCGAPASFQNLPSVYMLTYLYLFILIYIQKDLSACSIKLTKSHPDKHILHSGANALWIGYLLPPFQLLGCSELNITHRNLYPLLWLTGISSHENHILIMFSQPYL